MRACAVPKGEVGVREPGPQDRTEPSKDWDEDKAARWLNLVCVDVCDWLQHRKGSFHLGDTTSSRWFLNEIQREKSSFLSAIK